MTARYDTPSEVAAVWLTAAAHGRLADAWPHTTTDGRLHLAATFAADTGRAVAGQPGPLLATRDLADTGPAHRWFPELAAWSTSWWGRYLAGHDPSTATYTPTAPDDRWACVAVDGTTIRLGVKATGAGWRVDSITGTRNAVGDLRRALVTLSRHTPPTARPRPRRRR